MKNEKIRLEKQLKKAEEELKNVPAGSIYIKKEGNCFKWFLNDPPRKRHSILKENRGFAKKMAKKKYYLLKKKDLERELTAIGFYLRHHKSGNSKIDEMFEDDAGYRELLLPDIMPLSEQALQWQNEEYERNMEYPEHLKFRTRDGNVVRSKSEVLIANFLRENGIPYRYECPLEIDGTIVYPDFTILNPRTMEVYYIEHCGIMDSENYRRMLYSKLELYNRNGIIQDDKLLLLYETVDRPLDQVYLESKILEFLKNHI